MAIRIQRRKFITLVSSGVAAWPLAARGQQPAPVIGLLNGVSFQAYAERIAAFREGLGKVEFVEGRNVAIEYRSADGRPERLPALAADLVRRQVGVVVAIGGEASLLAAKAATASIPIVFATGGDAVAEGVVASLSRPDKNITGVTFLNSSLEPKRLQLLCEVVRQGPNLGYFYRSKDRDPKVVEALAARIKTAARSLGRELAAFDIDIKQDIDAAFDAMVQQRVAALIVSASAFFNSLSDHLIRLAAHHAIPTMYANREYVSAGGLMSYGVELNELYRQAGVYAGRILRGAKVADLPVLQPTKFELVINLKTAKALGLEIPPLMLAIANEVVE
jgi:putative tryptophan/tyrosine transport system substrate-binding protein